MSQVSLPSDPLTVRQLRSRWKPHKERLLAERPGHPTHVRFHRACSWLQSVEGESQADPDHHLITQWIAFNALYGQWNAADHEPVGDRECWRAFADRIVDLDESGLVIEMLRVHKPLVLALLDDEYLSQFFWKAPGKAQAGKARRARFRGQSMFVEGSWKLILEQVLDRIYLMRCQLVHGAATHSSRLNRKSLQRCSKMLGHLLSAFLQVWIAHGSEEDWGIMCYPPQVN